MTDSPNVEPKPELLAVIQEDREAAADLIGRGGLSEDEIWPGGLRGGDYDASHAVQAFARHRLDTRPTPAAVGDVERVELIEAAIGGFAISVEKLLCGKLGIPWSATGLSIETLIERLAAEGVKMREALAQAAAKFREYEKLHSRKLLPDRTPDVFFQGARDHHNAEVREKVARNREMAEMCEGAVK